MFRLVLVVVLSLLSCIDAAIVTSSMILMRSSVNGGCVTPPYSVTTNGETFTITTSSDSMIRISTTEGVLFTGYTLLNWCVYYAGTVCLTTSGLLGLGCLPYSPTSVAVVAGAYIEDLAGNVVSDAWVMEYIPADNELIIRNEAHTLQTWAYTTPQLTTQPPTTATPTTPSPTTAVSTTLPPSTPPPTTTNPTTSPPSTVSPSTSNPSTSPPSTLNPSTSKPSTSAPTSNAASTTSLATTVAPTYNDTATTPVVVLTVAESVGTSGSEAWRAVEAYLGPNAVVWVAVICVGILIVVFCFCSSKSAS